MARFSRLLGFAAIVVFVSAGVVVYANHSWGGYHWARTANPFMLNLGDNVSSVWDGRLALASNDWSVSSVLDTAVDLGKTNPKRCSPTSGRVEVCNSKYGRNGWLGMASIWVSGSHITKGTVKLNDSYFNTAKYNTLAWRQMVMCQEIGHTLGLDHQDENFNNAPLGTCMDYTSDPTPNRHPNQHDYDMLEVIYAHLDFTTTVRAIFSNRGRKWDTDVVDGNVDDVDFDNPMQWGKELKKSSDGRSSLHERDLGKGNKVFTFVIWADVEQAGQKMGSRIRNAP